MQVDFEVGRPAPQLFLIGGALLAVGVRRAFGDPKHYRGKISGSILASLRGVYFS